MISTEILDSHQSIDDEIENEVIVITLASLCYKNENKKYFKNHLKGFG
jgi:hypothetical protein